MRFPSPLAAVQRGHRTVSDRASTLALTPTSTSMTRTPFGATAGGCRWCVPRASRVPRLNHGIVEMRSALLCGDGQRAWRDSIERRRAPALTRSSILVLARERCWAMANFLNFGVFWVPGVRRCEPRAAPRPIWSPNCALVPVPRTVWGVASPVETHAVFLPRNAAPKPQQVSWGCTGHQGTRDANVSSACRDHQDSVGPTGLLPLPHSSGDLLALCAACTLSQRSDRGRLAGGC
jgi:hypothetical protein